MSELEALLTASVANPLARTAPYKHHRFVGSGDIAAIAAYYVPEWAHLAKWKNASDCWLRLCHGVDIPRTGRMQRGLDVEPAKRELYRQTIGECTEAPGMQRHPRLSWAAASPDGFDGPDGVVEIKSHSVFQQGQFGEPGTDLVPDKYNLQGLWLLEVTGRRWVNYLVSFGRDLPVKDGGGWLEESTAVYRLNDNSDLRAQLVEYAQRFIDDHVSRRAAPAILPVNNRREFRRLTK